jgi:hypothetical protein
VVKVVKVVRVTTSVKVVVVNTKHHPDAAAGMTHDHNKCDKKAQRPETFAKMVKVVKKSGPPQNRKQNPKKQTDYGEVAPTAKTTENS